MTLQTSPLEEEEQTAFVQWLELVGLRFTAIPNSTYTTSWKQKSKNYYTGLRPGFPDMVVLIPPRRARDGQGHFLCIEMKRKTGGVISQVQKEWHSAINGLGNPGLDAVVARGAQEAIEYVNTMLIAEPTSPF